MSDDRVPPVRPSSPATSPATSPDESREASALDDHDDDSGGFLLDADAGSPEDLDGEQLFRQAVAVEESPSASPLSPLSPAPIASPPGVGDGAAPATDTAGLARIIGLGTIGLGVIAFLASRELPLPLFLIAVGAALTYVVGSPTRLLREQVVERWDCLIDGAAERGDTILTGTTARLAAQGLPAITWDERQFAASFMRGGRRPFLVVTQTGAGRLRPYKMYVSVRDYGSGLQTSWFLIYHRGWLERLKPNPLVGLNLFDEQDLRASVTAVHHAFLDGVLDLMLALNQDTSRVERKTNGFLGIS